MEQKVNKKVTKGALVEFLRKMLTTNERWAKAALIRIYENQTSTEQNGAYTSHLNGIGFTVGDAHLMTKFADWFKSHGWLSTKQMKWVFSKIGKYTSQLMKMEYFSMEKLEAAYIRANNVA